MLAGWLATLGRFALVAVPTSLSPNPAKLIVGVFVRRWAALAHRARRCSATVVAIRSINHVLTIVLTNSTYFIIVRGGAHTIVQLPALARAIYRVDPSVQGILFGKRAKWLHNFRIDGGSKVGSLGVSCAQVAPM